MIGRNRDLFRGDLLRGGGGGFDSTLQKREDLFRGICSGGGGGFDQFPKKIIYTHRAYLNPFKNHATL